MLLYFIPQPKASLNRDDIINLWDESHRFYKRVLISSDKDDIICEAQGMFSQNNIDFVQA